MRGGELNMKASQLPVIPKEMGCASILRRKTHDCMMWTKNCAVMLFVVGRVSRAMGNTLADVMEKLSPPIIPKANQSFSWGLVVSFLSKRGYRQREVKAKLYQRRFVKRETLTGCPTQKCRSPSPSANVNQWHFI